MNCTNCGNVLDLEEEAAPNRDKSGKIICDQCYEEKYEHVCPICGEMFPEDFSKDISPEYFLLTEGAADVLGVIPGLYKIIAYPFYYDGMIEMSLIETAIEKIAGLPKDVCENDLHYVCENCAGRCSNERAS